MIVSVELDVVTDEQSWQGWVAEWDGVRGELVAAVGPAGGWPVVRLSGELVAVWPMVVAYAGGDEDWASELMS